MGVGALGAVVAVLLQRAGLPWVDVGALVALLVLLPVLSVLQVRAVEPGDVERMPAYVSSVVSLLFLGGVTWALGARPGAVGDLALNPLPMRTMAAWTGILVGAGLAVTLLFRGVGGVLGLRETPLLRTLLPTNLRERAAFTLLSGAAGLGEELAYRGYVIGVLAVLVGPAWAAVLSSVVFGLLHIYQGPVGMLRTGILGGILAWGLLASGSLFPPIVAHMVLDVVLGVMLAERMMLPERAE